MKICECGIIPKNSSHFKLCKEYKKILNDIKNKITKEFLITEYINNGKSLAYLAKQLGLSKSTIIHKKLKEYNIPIRNLQEAKKLKHHIELAKKTSLEKYGVEFHFQTGSYFSEISKQTNLQKYGVENVFQSLEIKNKIKETNLKKYGVECIFEKNSPIRLEMEKNYFLSTGYINPWMNPEITQKCLNTKFENNKINYSYSKKSQNLFYTIYNNLPEELQKFTYFATLNKEFGKYDNTNKRYYYYDFVITNIKYALEYNGLYYHAYPLKYNEDFYNKHTKCTAKEIWEKDKIKQQFIKNLDFILDIIWENNENNEIISNILNTISILYIKKNNQQ